MTLRTLNYGNYGIFLIMGNAGFCPSTVVPRRLMFSAIRARFHSQACHKSNKSLRTQPSEAEAFIILHICEMKVLGNHQLILSHKATKPVPIRKC